MNKEDLFRAIGDTEDTYLEETAAALTPKKKPVWGRVGALAACLALVAAGALIWKPWQTTAKQGTEIQLKATESEEPQQNGILPEQTDSTPSYTFPPLDFSQPAGEAFLDIGPQKGGFEEELTPDQIAAIWGQKSLDWAGHSSEGGSFEEELTPDQIAAIWEQETLNWEGYAPEDDLLTGKVTYNSDGSVWMVTLRYLQYGDQDHAALVISLSPGELPPTCIVYDNEDGKTLSVEGYVPAEVVTSGYGDYRRATFLRGEGDNAVGVMVEGYYGDYEELITKIVGQSLREDGVLQLSHLVPEEIPYWRSESLTEAQAYAEDGLGSFLPTDLPDGYRFHEAYREIGQNRDWLNVSYRKDTEDLTLCLYPNKTPTGLVHADEVEKYDLALFGEKPEVPPELYSSWSCPTFYAEELTMEVVNRRLQAAHTDRSDLVFASFSVLFADGTLMDVNIYAKSEDVPALLSFLLH